MIMPTMRCVYTKRFGTVTLCLRWLFLLSLLASLEGCAGLGLLQGMQSDQIVQGNADKAKKAADYANHQTCPAAAGFVAAAQSASADATAKASQSASLTAGVRVALDQKAEILAFLGPANEKLERLKADLVAASAKFDAHLVGNVTYPTVPLMMVGDNEVLSDVIRDAGALSEASLQLSRGLLTIAQDFEILVNTDSASLAAFLPPSTDASKIASDFRTAANNMLGKTIAVAQTPYTVPADLSKRAGDPNYKWPIVQSNSRDTRDDYDGFQHAMYDLHILSHKFQNKTDASGAWTQWDAVTRLLDDAIRNIENSIYQSNNEITRLADETYLLSAEATRNAWLAHEACGGELPPDMPPLENPFDTLSPRIPDWNSTFWDISS